MQPLPDRFKTQREEVQHKLTGEHLAEKGPLDSSFSDAAGLKDTAATVAAGLGRRRRSRRGPRADVRQSNRQGMSNTTETVTVRNTIEMNPSSQRETCVCCFVHCAKLCAMCKGRCAILSLHRGGRDD